MIGRCNERFILSDSHPFQNLRREDNSGLWDLWSGRHSLCDHIIQTMLPFWGLPTLHNITRSSDRDELTAPNMWNCLNLQWVILMLILFYAQISESIRNLAFMTVRISLLVLSGKCDFVAGLLLVRQYYFNMLIF